MQSGNYIALKISAESLGEALEDATITATYNGRTVTLDSDRIIIVRFAEGEDTITFTATKEGYSEGRLTLDLSGLTLEEEPFKFLIHSNNTNVVIDEDGEYLPSGSEVEITGQVPWSTTGNQNDFSVTINTKQEIVGEWEGANVRVYYDAISPVVLYSGSMSLTPPSTIGILTFTLPITAAAITDGTIYFEITELNDQSQVVNTYSVEADISNLALEAAPYNPETDPFFELSGVTYNGNTYDVSDFVSGGTLTRGYNGSQNNLVLTGATIKYCEIDSSYDQNYYLAFTSRVGAEVEHEGSYYEFTELSLNNSLNNPPSPHTLPQTFLVKVNRNTDSISGSGKFKLNSHTTSNKSPKIYLQNCTWEADPRPEVDVDWIMLPPTAQYNGTPVTDYVVNTYFSGQWPTQTYAYNNGYYGFLQIENSQASISNDLSSYIDYIDVTANITGAQLGTYDKVYMYDITTLNRPTAPVKFYAPGHKPTTRYFIKDSDQILPAYANGLTPRNMTIKPLDSTAKADKFGNWCDIDFTPIDPSTATIVNNEITVSVSGTINTKTSSDDTNAGSTLTRDYKPMYKTRNEYFNIESGSKIWLNKNTYYFIVEIDNAFILIDSDGSTLPWQCKGFKSTQTDFTTLAAPKQLSPAKKSIWAIPIESGMTSVSIKCIPKTVGTYTEVTYTFDLTNVTYSTFS